MTLIREKTWFLWVLSGGLIGFGWVGIWTIGLPFVLLGLGLGIYLAGTAGFAHLWAGVLTAGAVPAGVLGFDIAAAAPTCSGAAMQLSQAGSISCSQVPESYIRLAIISGCISLAGLAWGVATHFVRRS